MDNQVANLLKEIKVPSSNDLLINSNVLLKAEPKGDIAFVKINKDGLTSELSKKLEEDIQKSLKSNYSDDQIHIVMVSKNPSEPVQENSDKSKAAQIQMGHGQVGNKKDIPNVKNIIAIGSGKGGVGKSTVSVNFALTLRNKGFKVGVIDSDIYGPSVPMLLGQRDAQPKGSKDKKIVPIEAHGIKFISFGLFVKEQEAVIWRGPMLNGVLNQFLFDVDWGELDYLIVDLPPGTGDVQLSLIQNTNVDGAIIVTTPQDLALLDAVKAIKMFEKVKTPVLGIVENMSSFVCDGCGKEHLIFGKHGAEKASKELNIPFLGSIPLEMKLRESADNGIPFMSEMNNEGSITWNSYLQVASSIGKKEKTGLWSRIFGK